MSPLFRVRSQRVDFPHSYQTGHKVEYLKKMRYLIIFPKINLWGMKPSTPASLMQCPPFVWIASTFARRQIGEKSTHLSSWIGERSPFILYEARTLVSKPPSLKQLARGSDSHELLWPCPQGLMRIQTSCWQPVASSASSDEGGYQGVRLQLSVSFFDHVRSEFPAVLISTLISLGCLAFKSPDHFSSSRQILQVSKRGRVVE